MKKVLLLTLAISFCASMAFGQAGGIGLYTVAPPVADSLCYLTDAPGIAYVYAVHKYCPGSTASQWRVVSGGGFGCIYLAETVHMPVVIGNTQIGISLGYGGCLACDVLMVTLIYQCVGTSPACAFLEVVDDPIEPNHEIVSVGCDLVRRYAVGSKLYVNADGTCAPCGLPTRETNWGKIKSLYN